MNSIDETILQQIKNELVRATAKFPTWPNDPIHAMAVVNEEIGELNQAVLQAVYEDGEFEPVYQEAIQSAAMLFRFLDSLYKSRYNFVPGKQHSQA